MKASYHRHDISDEVWTLLEPHLPGQRGQWGGLPRITGALLLRWQLNNRQRNNIQFNAVLLAPCGATAKHGKYYFGNP